MELDKASKITFEDWACGVTLINLGKSQDLILNILSVELPVWQQSSLEWNDRIEKDSALAQQYGSIYQNPYIGKFFHLKPVTDKNIDLDNYYKILTHTTELEKHGFDFLKIIEENHNIKWSQWSEMIRQHLDYELTLSKNRTKTDQEEFSKLAAMSKLKWKTYWSNYYSKHNIDLTQNINF